MQLLPGIFFIKHFDDVPSFDILKKHINTFFRPVVVIRASKIRIISYFSCPDYATPRATLTASVINILQKNHLNYLGNQSKLYLYGHPSIIFTDNRKIILSTINYIKSTLRFST